MKKPLFQGCCTALATPFDEMGRVDFDALAAMIDFQLSGGAAAIALCATTGEGATLSEGEFEQIISAGAKLIGGRVPLLAGAGKNCTLTTLHMCRIAQKAGSDALLLCNPYYNKSTQTGIAEHFEFIADRVDIPIILYSVPSRTGIAIAPDTYRRLAQHPRIIGAKEASGDLSLIARAIAACGSELTFYSGNDDQTVAVLALGGAGVISTASNLVPVPMAEMCNLWKKGKTAAAAAKQLELLELIDGLFCETNPIPLKYALGKMGLCTSYVRLPLVEPTAQTKQRLDKIMQKFGIGVEI